jgi:hypothetical protein
MRSSYRWLVGVVTCLGLLGCDGDDGLEQTPTIVAAQISGEQLPPVFDESRVFFFPSRVQDPQHVLRVLWAAGIRPRNAWQPLESGPCIDFWGPRFTVELDRDDPRVLDYSFERGIAGLRCSTRLMAYLILEPGS